MIPKIYPLCETALSIEFGSSIDDTVHEQVMHLNKSIQQKPFAGFVETVPSYTTLTVYYQPELIESTNTRPFVYIKNYIESLFDDLHAEVTSTEEIVSIPVCYDDEFGYDLDFIAANNKLTKEQVIAIHQQRVYKVYMMGFLPGFAYMGSVDEAIAMPRKSSPRAQVEAGSVGIAGIQTGIYPLTSPGGWQIVGRTPLSLFNIQSQNPFWFKTGDRIKFFAICKDEFIRIKNEQEVNKKIESEEINSNAIVIRPGAYSTIQDKGRWGFQSYGMPVSGAMDQLAYYIANALAGNDKNASCIECTMGGLQIQFKKNAVVAITGAGAAFVNGQSIKLCQPLSVSKNDTLEIRYNNDGMRTYIAVRGGFAANRIMNSRSVYTRAGIGSPLKKEQGLQFGNLFSADPKRITESLSVPTYSSDTSIRIIAGPENHWMKPESIVQLSSQSFTLSNQCDRMGYQLKAEPLVLNEQKELLSTAVTKGTVQLTPSGQLIILMSDCQTTGGYPRVAQVAAVDLSVLAQLKPGDGIHFSNISFQQAEALYLSEQKKISEFFH
jgi:KipI family sensor histidine kinase inhibitor